MTYFGFLLRFLVLPILVFLIIALRDQRQGKENRGFHLGRFVWAAIGLHILIALVYTTPWDNYLVATGVWYYNPEGVSGIVFGWGPLEEYLFFVLEPLLTGLWWWFLARRVGDSGKLTPDRRIRFGLTAIFAAVWILALTQMIFGPESFNYLTLILVWVLPAFILQIAYGADILWHHRRLAALTILPMSLYLSAADALAITRGIWTIDPAQTLGIMMGGALPLEEALFFFSTVVLIGTGLTLSLSKESQMRWKSLRESLMNLARDLRIKNKPTEDQGL